MFVIMKNKQNEHSQGHQEQLSQIAKETHPKDSTALSQHLYHVTFSKNIASLGCQHGNSLS